MFVRTSLWQDVPVGALVFGAIGSHWSGADPTKGWGWIKLNDAAVQYTRYGAQGGKHKKLGVQAGILGLVEYPAEGQISASVRHFKDTMMSWALVDNFEEEHPECGEVCL